ncbi:MAG: Calx-beta domain-containing protein, partial [Microcystis panniformis]
LNANGRNVTIADTQGQGTINNDDIAPPKITIAPGTNPVEGGTVGTFIITLDTPAPTGGIVVNFNTTGSTATILADYSLTAGTNITAVTANTFTIAAGATSATLNVVALSDAVNDPNETVKVNLTSGGDYILGANSSASFNPATNFSVGSNPLSVTVGDFNSDGKLDLATANYKGNNVSVLLGTGTGSFGTPTNFIVGSGPYSVTVGDFNGDGKLDLATANYNGNNVSVLLGTGTGSFGTATNFSVGNLPYSVTVGDFNGDGKSDLAVANFFSNNVSVLLGTGTGSFGPATNFFVGSFPRSVTVGDFNGDGKSDLATANPSNGGSISILLNADPTATVTITDPSISLTINDVTVTEGNSGTTNAVFTVSLSSAASTVVSVDYATANGTATAGTDYTAIPTTTLTFNPGETSKTITVAVNGDNQVELNETFFLNLSNLQANGSNVTLADNQGQGTINNDDSASIAITDVTVTEGNSGTTNAVFTVTLSNPIDTAITLNYATADGTATTADNDYIAIATTSLTFNAGETSKTITVAVNGDTKVESNETFFVNLSNLQTNGRNVTIADNQGQGTITDDDTLQSITILDFESPLPQGLSSVSFWQGTSVPSTAKITNQYAPSGVLMSGVALINHGLGHAASGVNGIGGIGLESSVDYDAPLTFQFVSSVNSSTPAYTNYFAISPDLWGGSGNNVKITAYGFDNTILGVTTYTETGNLSPSTPIEIQNVGKIYKVVVDASLAFVGGGGIGFDLVKFEVPTVDAPSITLAV